MVTGTQILLFGGIAAMLLASHSIVEAKSTKAGTQQRLLVQHKFLNLFKPLAATNDESTGYHVDISEVARVIPKDGAFNYMIPAHKRAVKQIVLLLKDEPSLGKAFEVASQIRLEGKINMNAWYFAVTAWSLSDPRLQAVPKPSPVDITPDNFINVEALAQAAEMREMRKRGMKADECIVIDGTAGADNGRENDVWYWREDLMNNAFHMFYHLYYLPDEEREDRRSETFYFLHRDVIARFDAERISNRLPRTKSLVWGQGSLIEEVYYPHLNASYTSLPWTDRQANTPLSDIVFETPEGIVNISMSDVLVFERRIYEAINVGNLFAEDGSLVPINNLEGTDILGDVIEGNDFMINGDYYGSLMPIHGSLHLAIAISGLPIGTETFGVMASPSTSFRDVVFYRWHMYINDLFDANKQRLRPYTPTGGELPLVWNGVSVTEVSIQPQASGDTTNELFTFFNERRFELKMGLDYLEPIEEPIDVCAKHLDHEDFVYKIVVNSDNFFTRPATVRVFLAPRADENDVRFDMRAQRDLIFTLDVFQTTLQPGENVIYRASNASSATIPWHQMWNELDEGNYTTPACGCGLPQHLNIPKGRAEGMQFDLVVMVTNFVDDAVEYEEPECRAAYLYCGLPGTKYPDSKPMGYPFDRLPYHVDENGSPSESGTPVRDLDEYIRHVPNMATTQVTVTHLGDLGDRQKRK